MTDRQSSQQTDMRVHNEATLISKLICTCENWVEPEILVLGDADELAVVRDGDDARQRANHNKTIKFATSSSRQMKFLYVSNFQLIYIYPSFNLAQTFQKYFTKNVSSAYPYNDSLICMFPVSVIAARDDNTHVLALQHKKITCRSN